MNQLQQEMKNFHENLRPVLEKILEQYGRKVSPDIYHTIIKPCKQLIQKCSFKSLSDTSSLCSLAYWLYICDYKKLALEICELTHGVDFVFEDGHNRGYPEIYGLEVRIARELLGENRRDHIPPDLLGFYFSKRVKKQLRFPQILRKEEIAACNDDQGLEIRLLGALYDMIGKGETGLYSELNENWGEIEETIIFYIDYLKINK